MTRADEQALRELLRDTEAALRRADSLDLLDAGRHFDAARISICRLLDPDTRAGSLDDAEYLPVI